MSVIKIVFGQLLLQSALLKQVIDRSALAEICLGDFYDRFGVIRVCGDIVIYIQWFFVATHQLTPG
ncbi:hypothetical protein EDF87_12822 [Pseudomonas helmanticensis]|jgi:hypothetical protein|uniref:Uncharacterized protein n=2 Tax=Pseudomonas TaxID=286 RepID=A0A4R7URE7_9PSED|nr:hypothetical protein EDF87_12822 [Pseudomonas helmanticensis]VVQ02047.1 hypothetical protein PS941_02680 [Pseudomonas fluorescens]